jgi:hypothetical protein
MVFTLDNGMNLISHLVYYLPTKFPLKKTPKTINCDRTMMGFVVNQNAEEKGTMKKHPVQCMYGIRQPKEGEK